ncbi:MAG TPA: hypothetical protein VGA78_03565, partial [Gemmatimonadales bacterium]
MTPAVVVRAAGALVEAAPLRQAALNEIVRVGPRQLLGEVIRLDGDCATVQVFEETSGLALDAPVLPTGAPLLAELGPGLLGSVLDGIGRPLELLARREGGFIGAGTTAPTLDRERRWAFAPSVAIGASVEAGDVLGSVEEREGITHRVMVPPGAAGMVTAIAAGEFTVEDVIGQLEDGTALRLAQHWPVRIPRPVKQWLPPSRPFMTGQRVFDFL